jgi:hypothetical protein
MNFTFGIITINKEFINEIINSIELQNIPEYEIILVGNIDINRKNVINIQFNENIHPKWITKKKNIITQNAKYENIVYMHDYIKLDINWYKGICEYGNNFDILINPIINYDGTRFRDWILNGNFILGQVLIKNNNIDINNRDNWVQVKDNVYSKYVNRILNLNNNRTLFLDYNDDADDLQDYIYISGSYFICKKYVMIEYPLNENHLWAQSEDIEWCQRVRNKYKFKINKNSTVFLLKQK